MEVRSQNPVPKARPAKRARLFGISLDRLGIAVRRIPDSARFAVDGVMRSSPPVRAIIIASWSYLTVACILALSLWGLSDRWWPATVVLFSGRWIFLTPLIALLPAAIVLRRALLVPLLFAGAIILVPVMGFRLGLGRLLPHATGEHVRVVTLNADEGSRIAPNLPILIAEWQPDIVAIQECGSALTDATRNLADWYHHTTNGTCLLSRYPIRSVNLMDRGALERVKQDAAAGIGGAGYVTRYTLATPSGDIAFTNLHLETPRKGLEVLGEFKIRRLQLNTELRDIESDLARRWVDRGAAPLLVAGDFNTPVESRIFQDHWTDLTDAFSRVGFGLGMTKYNGWIQVRIDHVLSGPEWRVDHAVVGGDVGSDHRPLIVDLTLMRPAIPIRN